MTALDSQTLEDLFIDVTAGDQVEVQHPKTIVFTSLNSTYLSSYENRVIQAKDFDNDTSLEGLNKEYIRNYRRFLGFRHIHLGALDMAGFFNPNYDVSFGFETKQVLSQPHLLFDHDALMQLLLYGQETSLYALFQDTYSQDCEIVTRELDLKQARLALTYSHDAKQRTEACLGDAVKAIDASALRKRAIKLQFE
jgi:hypothetical protein